MNRGAIDIARLGPRRDVLGPDQYSGPTAEEIVRQAQKILDLRSKGHMHYRNGREAKNGDRIVQISEFYAEDGKTLVPTITAIGVLHGAKPGNDYCNGSIAPIQNAVTGACMCDCLHVDDLAALLKEKGLDKRPAGK